MESIKALEAAAKECLKDLRTIESRVSITEGNLRNMEASRDALKVEVSELGAKKAELMEFIGTAALEAQKENDARLRDIRIKEEALQADRANLKARVIQYDSARVDMERSKEQYDRLYAEYEARLADFNHKRQAAAEILSK